MVNKIVVSLDVFSRTPLYQQLAGELKKLIASGDLNYGEKLPSIRELSRQLQISTITVREALDHLIAEKLVIARHGSGNYVAQSGVTSLCPVLPTPMEEVRFTLPTFVGGFHEL